ncbi:DUF1499 domain-containing protein [Hyphomonas johnsonii]|uniref:DUF1499 domain-containing protein n=1 Tax=Hyphomonas johnsonii MHS-2 TaxID=1280950 RepID=A0A059FAH2_9PROT|nr:DUF1499 domain-containing protein [Hyphomonas johnsonii]KCZ87602.1 hypothetical protein HJO_16555 [Hyphomonas johnsonii MHS-2]
MTDFIDFQTFKRQRKPNNWLVAPDGFADTAHPDESAPVFDRTPASLFDDLMDMIAARNDWQIKASDPGSGRISFVAVTRVMKFKDDIDIQVLPVSGHPGQSTLAVYSGSRIGHSDFGTNAKRVNALLGALSMP